MLLAIIYIAFISLGLPDSLLGAAWPVMYGELGVPISYAGIVTMIIAAGTIVSSLLSDWLMRKVGAGVITAVSVFMTAAALFGFSASHSFLLLCLWAVPYGLGAGAVDVALNNYVALHFSSRHMNWLHCFWSVGAAASPYIMSYCLTGGFGWNNGYRSVAVVQTILTAALFLSLPLWKRRRLEGAEGESAAKALSLPRAVKIKGVPFVLIMFFGYCALEQAAGLWASSYLVQFRGVDTDTAAWSASLFYLGIAAGRFLCGFVAERLGDRRLIRIGILTMIGGVLLIALPVPYDAFTLAGLLHCWPGVCAGISVCDPFDSGKLWQGEFTGNHRYSDGERLRWHHFHAAAVWPDCGAYSYWAVPSLPAGAGRSHAVYVGKAQPHGCKAARGRGA